MDFHFATPELEAAANSTSELDELFGADADRARQRLCELAAAEHLADAASLPTLRLSRSVRPAGYKVPVSNSRHIVFLLDNPMPAEVTRPFSPDYSIPPGDTLLEVLETIGLSQAELAERTGRPKKTINEIIKGKAAITPDTALQLERVLGRPTAGFWISLEQKYRATIARLQERERLSKHVGWLGELPIGDLISRGWVRAKADKIDLVQELLGFFGVASPEAWEEVWRNYRKATAFRKSANHSSDFGVMAAWLRRGEIEGRDLECAPFSATRFKQALRKIRNLTTEEPNHACKLMIEECAAAGVAVVLVPELPKLRLFGATRWLSADKALLQLSLYYKRDDQFWFSFFHEAGHILLHGKRDIFIEQARGLEDRDEQEANKFASDYLVPPDAYADFCAAGDFKGSTIIKFAHRVGISPSVVVGRLQHDKIIKFSELNDLHTRLDWA